jgi:NAD-dependent SIR2 family protein deacetylase
MRQSLPTPGRYDTIYVLGAGCSAAAGLPTVANFKRAARALLREATFSLDDRQRFDEAMRFWDEQPNANIEELYVLADTLSRAAVRTSFGVEQARGIQYLIAKTLSAKAKGPSRRKWPHLEFVKNAWAYDQPACVISLNWDTTLEHAIQAYYGGTSYGDGLQWPPVPGESVAFREVLKLHGSVNWRYCTACTRLDTVAPDADFLEIWERPAEIRCTCGAQGKWAPGFVPPTGQKLGSDTPFHTTLGQHWSRAYHLLGICDRLVIIGYSFPPTDLQFRMFLLDALRQNDHLQEITVVTDRKWGARKLNYENHIDSIFENSSHHRALDIVDNGFEKWAYETWWVRGD